MRARDLCALIVVTLIKRLSARYDQLSTHSSPDAYRAIRLAPSMQPGTRKIVTDGELARTCCSFLPLNALAVALFAVSQVREKPSTPLHRWECSSLAQVRLTRLRLVAAQLTAHRSPSTMRSRQARPCMHSTSLADTPRSTLWPRSIRRGRSV